MKITIKIRILASLLCLVMLLFLVACAKQNDNANTTTKADGNVTDVTSSEDPTVTTEPKEQFEVSKTDYKGAVFNILLSGNWGYTEFEAENIIGEAINDSRYEINSLITELLNVNIVVENISAKSSGGAGAGFQAIMTDVTSGSQSYDAASIGCYDVGTLAYNGYLADLYNVPNIDLSKSWWDPKLAEQLSINGHLYYSTGDAMTLDNDCTYCILFNKSVVRDKQLENPYELVETNQWTLEKMLEMADACDSDLNGDGKYDGNDAYGILMWTDSLIGMLHASGGRFATIKDGNNLEMTINTERNIDVMTKWIKTKESSVTSFLDGSTSETAHAPFTQNHCLFYTRYIKAASWFRDLDLDFGFLPYPKYSADQDSYCNTMHAYGTSFLCVPTSCVDSAMSGAVLESLAYYGKEKLTPAYYDMTLYGKYIRDEESIGMLDLIFSTRFFDIGTYYQLGGLNENLLSMLRSGGTSFNSIFKASDAVCKKQISTIVEAFNKLS